MPEGRQSYRIDQLNIDDINAMLGLLADRLDELEGRRGTPTFYSDINANNQKIQNLANAISAADAIPLQQLESLGTDLIPNTDATYNIGSTTYGWEDAYLTGSLFFDDTNSLTHDGTDFVFNDSVKATKYESTVATGTAPLTVASTTKVSNLNADQLDSLDSTAFAILAGQSGGQTLNGGTIASDNLILDGSSNATRGWVGVVAKDDGTTIIHGFK